MAGIEYVHRDRVYDEGQARDLNLLESYHTAVCIKEIEDGKRVLLFSDEDEFLAWNRTSPITQHVKKIDDLVKKAQSFEHIGNDDVIYWQRLLSDRTISDMKILAERFRLDVTSVELFKIAHEGASIFEPPIIRSATLYDHGECGGSWRVLFTGVPYPNLSWIGFNDRASSVRLTAGIGMLTQHRWFRGRRVFVSGIATTCIPLAPLNFHNIASSAIVT